MCKDEIYIHLDDASQTTFSEQGHDDIKCYLQHRKAVCNNG